MAVSRKRIEAFQLFMSMLSIAQQDFLVQHTDLFIPELQDYISRSMQSGTRLRNAHHSSSTSDKYNSCTAATPKTQRKKVVNSWMAFRFLIKDLPQKARSPILAMLYKHDTDRGLWELLSTAFSCLRDRHAEDNVSLDSFLAVGAHVLPIVPADQYFEYHGWECHGLELKRKHAIFHAEAKTTTFSCADLARYCYKAGLVSRLPHHRSDRSDRSMLCHIRRPCISAIVNNVSSQTPIQTQGADVTPLMCSRLEAYAGISELPRSPPCSKIEATEVVATEAVDVLTFSTFDEQYTTNLSIDTVADEGVWNEEERPASLRCDLLAGFPESSGTV